MFHFEQLDLGPLVDVVTVGKMSQACGCLYTPDYNPQPGLLSGTFIASTVALAVGRRALERLRDGDYYGDGGRIAELHATFARHVARLDVPHGGVGGMMRFTPFDGEKKKILDLLHKMFELGVIAFYCGHGPYHVRFLPPVGVMEPDQMDEVFSIVRKSMEDVACS
jgi:4-aminobutyrate aminotransferase-like enzyme